MVVPLFATPSSGKWTKTGRALDGILLDNCNGLLESLKNAGLSNLPVSSRLYDDNDRELDDTMEEFNKVVGAKEAVARNFLANQGAEDDDQ